MTKKELEDRIYNLEQELYYLRIFHKKWAIFAQAFNDIVEDKVHEIDDEGGV